MRTGFANVVPREWENSDYQYEQGLFNVEEFEGRLETMRAMINTSGFHATWEIEREKFAAPFQSLIDGLVTGAGPE